MRSFKKMVMLIFKVLCSLVMYAQETTSEIQGIVSDERGSALTGAAVVAIHQPAGTNYATTTRKDGRYNIPNVRVGGPYEIKVTFIGYAEADQKEVITTLGQSFKADFALVPNNASLTEVVVAARRSDKVFSRNRTDAAEIINRQQIDRLPTINRSIQDFARLTPTANGSSFAGGSNSYNNLTVNGASFNNTFGLSGTLGGQTNSQPISASQPLRL